MSGEGSGKKGTGFKQESRVSQQYNIMYMLYDIMHLSMETPTIPPSGHQGAYQGIWKLLNSNPPSISLVIS